MITPRYYQRDAHDALLHFLGYNNGNPIVALPTATGKSVVIGMFICTAYNKRLRGLALTHVKELIGQNYNALKEMWPDAPAGINSSGLRQRDYLHDIIFAGIASIHKHAELFGWLDYILIDECHLLSPKTESMYQKFIADVHKINPKCRIIGFTATAFRLKQGSLTDNGLFTDIAYDLCKPEDFVRLISEGYLSPIFAQETTTKIDLTGVETVGGEFNLSQMDAAVDKPAVMVAALKEVCARGRDRRRWIVFNSGVENAEHTAEILNSWGVPTGVVHAGTKNRDQVLSDFHHGKLRCIANNNVLTTGYNEPGIDLIAMLRPTKSPGLWVQMGGRGMRVCPSEGKRNCIILDFAGNRTRLGPLNDPVIPGRPKPGGGTGEAPTKICPECGSYHHTSVRVCDCCGYEFPVSQKLTATPGVTEMIVGGAPIVHTFAVNSVACYKHVGKSSGKESMRVTYTCGLRTFSEYIAIGNTGRPQQWWQQRSHYDMPETIDAALQFQSALRCPTAIRVWVNKQYPEIIGYEW